MDGVTDPIIAIIIDKMNTRFGKIRILMVAGWLIESLAVLIMYCWASGKGHGIVLFVLLYCLYVIGYTMSVISVFRFKVKKKMRIAEYASVGTFGDRQHNTLERQPFTSRRFGSSSYLIILKGVETGEYGITVDALGSLNVSTFGVDE